MSNKLKLLIDCNEKQNIKDTISKIINKKFNCSITNCGVGDFHICQLTEGSNNDYKLKIVIERKTWSDYISSLHSGRLQRQRSEMLELNGVKTAFLIEGNRSKFIRHNSKNLLRENKDKFLLSSSIRDGISVIYTDDVEQTARHILWLMDRLNSEPDYLESTRSILSYAERAAKKRKTGIDQKQCYIAQLSCIPSLSVNLANEISNKYPTMYCLLSNIHKNNNEVAKFISEIKIGKNRYGKKRTDKIMEYLCKNQDTEVVEEENEDILINQILNEPHNSNTKEIISLVGKKRKRSKTIDISITAKEVRSPKKKIKINID